MPGKSRRGRSKPSARSKKRRDIVTRVAPQPLASKASEPVATAPTLPTESALSGTSAGIRYPYIGRELRRIGILAGILLAILIILALSLS